MAAGLLRLVFFIPRRLRPQSPATLAGALLASAFSRRRGTFPAYIFLLLFPSSSQALRARSPPPTSPPPKFPELPELKRRRFSPPKEKKPRPDKMNTGRRGELASLSPLCLVLKCSRREEVWPRVRCTRLRSPSLGTESPSPPSFHVLLQGEASPALQKQWLAKTGKAQFGGKGEGHPKGAAQSAWLK